MHLLTWCVCCYSFCTCFEAWILTSAAWSSYQNSASIFGDAGLMTSSSIIQHSACTAGTTATSHLRRQCGAATFRTDRKLDNTSSSTRVWGKDTCHGFTGYIYTLQGLFFSVFVVVSTDWGAYLPECIPVYTLVLHLQFIFDTMQRWHIEIIFCLQGITYFTRLLCNKSRPAMQQWERSWMLNTSWKRKVRLRRRVGDFLKMEWNWKWNAV